MRPSPWLLAEPYRCNLVPGLKSRYGDRFGVFQVPYHRGVMLNCIVDDGNGGLGPEYEWEHVSVSTKNRTPNWYEMSAIKDLFWDESETVMQLHVPKAKHVNIHPHVLHLWKKIGFDIPLPVPILV